MEQPPQDSARVVRIVEAGQSTASTGFAAMFSRSPLYLQLQDQLTTAMQKRVKIFRIAVKRVIAEEQMLEQLTAASQSGCMPNHIRAAAKVPHIHVRHEPASALLADRYAALKLQYQEQLLEATRQHTQQSVDVLTAYLHTDKTAAVADITAVFDAAVAHSEHKDDPAVRSLLTNALTLLDLDFSNVQSQQRQAAIARKEKREATEAKKLQQQQQRQQRQQHAGNSSAATAAAAGAAAAAAITAAAAAVPDHTDAAMGDADPEALPLNQEQHMQEQTAAAAANQPVTLNQVAMLMQQGITAALTAVTAIAPTRPQPPQQPQRSHRRRAATPPRARQQQQPTTPRNRGRSASQHRVSSHRQATGARSTSAERQPGRNASQQRPHRQQQSAQRSQHPSPNGHGGPAGHRSARKSSRRTDTAGNSRRLGRPSSH